MQKTSPLLLKTCQYAKLMAKLLIFTPSGTVAVSTGQFQYVSVVLDLSHFWWRMLRDSFPATRLWLQMKQSQRQRSMVCQRHTLLRRRRWIAEGVGSEVNSRVQPSPSISRPCTARVCLLPSFAHYLPILLRFFFKLNLNPYYGRY